MVVHYFSAPYLFCFFAVAQRVLSEVLTLTRKKYKDNLQRMYEVKSGERVVVSGCLYYTFLISKTCSLVYWRLYYRIYSVGHCLIRSPHRFTSGPSLLV